MRRASFGIMALAVASLAGCSQRSQLASASLPVGREAAPIINGTMDTTPGMFPEVVALVGTMGSNQFLCSGTIVNVSGTYGFVLTAGHCTSGTMVSNMIMGADTNSSSAQVYTVDMQAADPNFVMNGSGNGAPYNDYGMVRFVGASSSLPVTLPLAPSEDTLQGGEPVILVGYGTTSDPTSGSAMAGVRYYRNENITDLGQTLGDPNLVNKILYYDQAAQGGGTCEGDSGGPAIYMYNGQRRVAGTTSFGDQHCAQYGTSARVSLASSFITSFEGNTMPAMQSCSLCQSEATTAGGACLTQWNACVNSMDCQNFLNCLTMLPASPTMAQIDNCNTMYAAGLAIYKPVVQCICSPSNCDTAATCGSMCTPASGMGGSGGSGGAGGGTTGTGGAAGSGTAGTGGSSTGAGVGGSSSATGPGGASSSTGGSGNNGGSSSSAGGSGNGGSSTGAGGSGNGGSSSSAGGSGNGGSKAGSSNGNAGSTSSSTSTGSCSVSTHDSGSPAALLTAALGLLGWVVRRRKSA